MAQRDERDKMTDSGGMHTVKIVRAEFTPAVVLRHDDGGYGLCFYHVPTEQWTVVAIEEADGTKFMTNGKMDMDVLAETLEIDIPAWVQEGMEA